MNYSYAQLAGMIDHALLHPTMTDQEMEAGCQIARQYAVASVCIKPYAVRQAAQWLAGSSVRVGTAIGFPHGHSATEVKRYETQLACADGAVEIDVVLNLGLALSANWRAVEQDLRAVCDQAHSQGALVKVILETDFLAKGGADLSGDDLKRRLCQISEQAGADWVKTSTGFGFVRQPDGAYNYQGATEHDLILMRSAVSARVQVKASGGVRDLDGLIRVRDLGATRCGTSATVSILDQFRQREAAAAAGAAQPVSSGQLGAGGY